MTLDHAIHAASPLPRSSLHSLPSQPRDMRRTFSAATAGLCFVLCMLIAMAIAPASARLLPNAHPHAAVRHQQQRTPAASATLAGAADPLAAAVGHESVFPAHPRASPSASNFAQDAESACKSCCDGGSCSFLADAPASPAGFGDQTSRPRSVLRMVQCCGKLQNQPFCCAASSPRPSMIAGSGAFPGPAAAEKCHASDAGVYTCVPLRAPHYLFASVSYLSPAGLIVIVLLGSLFLCCYFSLAARRTHSAYYGQPYYAGQPAYAGPMGGSGAGAGSLCASCLAGFCCMELCCTPNLNF